MKLVQRVILKEIVGNEQAHILTDFSDLEWELNLSASYLHDNIDELLWDGYLVMFNQYYKATSKAYNYLNG